MKNNYGSGIIKRCTFLEGDINQIERGTREDYS